MLLKDMKMFYVVERWISLEEIAEGTKEMREMAEKEQNEEFKEALLKVIAKREEEKEGYWLGYSGHGSYQSAKVAKTDLYMRLGGKVRVMKAKGKSILDKEYIAW